jgi:hypothetical protein
VNGLGPLVNWDEVKPIEFDPMEDPTHVIEIRWAVHTGHANAIMQTHSAFASCTYANQRLMIACKSDDEAINAFNRLMQWFDTVAMFVVRAATLTTIDQEHQLATHSMLQGIGGSL